MMERLQDNFGVTSGYAQTLSFGVTVPASADVSEMSCGLMCKAEVKTSNRLPMQIPKNALSSEM